MSERDKSGPAFPTVAGNVVYSNGMTLRDWFAGQALAGIMAGEGASTLEADAANAYKVADAMLAARKGAAQ